jgi:alpha-glucosidase
MTYHDLEHLSPPFPLLGEEVEIFLETEAQEGLLLYEKDGQVAIFVGFSSAAQSGPMSR